jgi:sec-independent protein translocase protein TatB
VPQLSPLEILVVATIALIVFGPEKLPQIARTIGRGAAELRRMATEVKDEFQMGLDLDDDDEQPPKKKLSRQPHPNLAATPKETAAPTSEDEGIGDGASPPADTGGGETSDGLDVPSEPAPPEGRPDSTV